MHLHFHLTMDKELYPDIIGSDVADLAEAHSRAILLAARVMQFCELERRKPRAERWVIEIEDDSGKNLLSVIINCNTATDAARELCKRRVGTSPH